MPNQIFSNRTFVASIILLPFLAGTACVYTFAAPDNTAVPVDTTPAIAPARHEKPSLRIAVPDEAAFFGALDLDKPEMGPIKAAVTAQDWTAAKVAWAHHLETRTTPHWLWSRRDKAQIIRLLTEKDGGLERYIKPADAVLARQFVPQGVAYQLDKNINWQLKLSEETHVLSRFAYWRDMGLAYWQTGDAKYPADFVFMLKDWLNDNPVPHDLSRVSTPNTTWRSLEAGIRSEGWWDSMELFMDAPEFDAQAKYEMSKSLMEHARYLFELDTVYHRGNWQVQEATGLATTGMMMPEAKEASAWRERAFARLSEHMQQDILPDGAHSELTPGYHAAVMGQFMRALQLCKLNGYDVPGLLSRHEKMYEWLMDISEPDRTVPPLGDVHNQGQPIGTDMATGALLYSRPDMRFLGPQEAPPSWVWTFGADALERYRAIPSRRPDFTSFMAPDSKYIAMRSGWENNANFLLFDCAPWGGGHSHQDALQVVVNAGRNLLVDPGIYAYNQPLSSTYFRTARAHNVVIIDDKEHRQSDNPKSNPQMLAWQTTREADFASASLQVNDVHHQRSVLFVKPNYWVVVDHITGTGEHDIKRLFHLPPGEAVAKGNIAQTAFASGTNLQIQVADGGQLEMDKGWVTGGGATAIEAPVAVFRSKGTLPLTLCTVLSPFSDAKKLPKIESVPDDNPQIAHVRATFPDGSSDEIEIASQTAPLQIGEQRSHSRALIVHHQGPLSTAIVMDGSLPAPATR